MKEKLNQYRWLPPAILFGMLLFAALLSNSFPRLIWTWIEIVLFLCLAVYYVLFPRLTDDQTEKKTGHRLELASILLLGALMLLFNDSKYYCFADGGSFPFFVPSLILGIPLGVGLMLLHKKKGEKIKEVLVSLLIFCLLSFFTLNVLLVHLNFALDTQPPQEYTAVIEDKEYRNRRKGGNSYLLEITVDGQTLRQEVKGYLYHAYEVGDEYILKKYGGAFGEPFYLPGS